MDHRNAGVAEIHEYSSVAMLLLDKDNQIVDLDEFDINRNLQAEFKVAKRGKYFMIPLTSGCSLMDQEIGSPAAITDKNGVLTDKAKVVLYGIFQRLDCL